MFDLKRPGIGLSPDMINLILGKQCKRDIDYDELIKMSDFLKSYVSNNTSKRAQKA